ncbi:phosphopantetheine-binding protein [Streptomyces sp. NPDC001508]|uniref:phosphopantetheine-binding protein n=1 Tax=Streptomyces sp. NPDC001508 TaxID=3154656 RepID=UPI00332667F4
MISTDEIYTSATDFLTGHLQVSHDLITPDATLDSLGCDSLAAVELFLHLKGEFTVDVDEGKADPSLTLAQTVALFTQATNDTTATP